MESSCCGRPCDHSSRLYLVPGDFCRGFEVEILSNAEGQRLYLNLISFRLIEGVAELELVVDESMSTYTAQVLEGGQRLLFPPQATEEMINAWLGGKDVHLCLANRELEITHEGFIEKFTFLASPPVCEWSMDGAYKVIGLR